MKDMRIAELAGRAILEVSGAEAVPFLQGLLSNDVHVPPGRAAYAALLTPQGKFLHDMLLMPVDGGLLLDCDGARSADLLKRLRMYRLRAKVEIADRADLAAVAVFAPDGGETVVPAALEKAALALAPDPRLPALGWRGILPREMLATGQPVNATDADYAQHRLALGVPDGSPDIEEGKGLLLENNFEELHGVDFTKGCYVGQELTARTKHRALVKKRLWIVRADGTLPPPDTQVLLDGQDAGRMGSSRDGIGLALLRLDKLRASLAGEGVLVAGGVPLQAVRPSYLDENALHPAEG